MKFFRKIRYNLLGENKTYKYLKYAIGEIFLVVIGILIALQINNWNENRKIRITEQVLLKDLKAEVHDNIKQLDTVMASHQSSLKAAKELFNFWQNNQLDTLSETSAQSLINQMDFNFTYNPKKGVLRSIISSGNISYIKNTELKYLLTSIENVIEDASESTENIEVERVDLMNAAYSNIYIKKESKVIGVEFKRMFDVPEFWMAVIGKFIGIREEGLIEEYELKGTLEQMLHLIQNEIE
jgi:hypothetical protein